VTAPTFDEILKIEQVGEDLFEGATPPGAFTAAGPAIFGGQLVGQALLAAGLTAPDKARHSLHAYYSRPGDVSAPVTYEVARVRDGRSFSTRQVTARQGGKVVLMFMASFTQPEAGPAHQGTMPEAPGPEDPEINTGRLFWNTPNFHGVPMELRRVVPLTFPAPPGHPPEQRFWFRAKAKVAGGEAMQAAAHLRHRAPGDLDAAARRSVRGRQGRLLQPRPRPVVPPSDGRGGMAPVRPGEPVGCGRAGPGDRRDLAGGRDSGRHGGAGGADAVLRGLGQGVAHAGPVGFDPFVSSLRADPPPPDRADAQGEDLGALDPPPGRSSIWGT
jgi:hypothetical protein